VSPRKGVSVPGEAADLDGGPINWRVVKMSPAPSAALAGRRLQWSAAESDLVSVGIAVRDLAHAVGVGFPFHRVKSPIGYLRDERIEVIDEERVHGVAGVLRPLHNVQEPMLCKLPHGLC